MKCADRKVVLADMETPEKPRVVRDGEYMMPFGKHKGLTLKEISEQNPGYIKWLRSGAIPIKDKRLLQALQ
jgi:uncharacterized protein (DUF3820 family)